MPEVVAATAGVCCTTGLGLSIAARRCAGKLEGKQAQTSEEFAELITFLSSVPLFHKQLPKAELPKVARAFRSNTWQPGVKVIEQGKIAEAFFIIKSGEAIMIAQSGDKKQAKDSIKTTLCSGDYFGTDSLVKEQKNAATIVAKGPEALVTLFMTRKDFERLGLRKRLRFPKRRAVWHGRIRDYRQEVYGMEKADQVRSDTALSHAEEEFVETSLTDNINLRALMKVDRSTLGKLAKLARRRTVQKGAEVGHDNAFQQEFYVVASGAIDVIPGNHDRVEGTRSVEAVLQNRMVVERHFRKQEFLLNVMGRKRISVGRAMTLLSPGESTGSLGRSYSPPPSPRDPTKTHPVPPIFSSKSDLLRHNSLPETCPEEEEASLHDVSHRSLRAGSKKTPRLADERQTSEHSILAPRTSHVLLEELQKAQAEVQVGSRVRRARGSLLGTCEGKVVSLERNGTATVEFRSTGEIETVDVNMLHNIEEMPVIQTLHPGCVFGELSILYNTHQIATFRAAEDSEVYVITRRNFKECLGHLENAHHIEEYRKLLDEVTLLSPLLSAEREELARNATGFMEFKAKEHILVSGVEREMRIWYVIAKGTAYVKRNEDDKLITLLPGCHFGERSILKAGNDNPCVPEFDVYAGRDGCTCLLIDGSLLTSLPLNPGQDDDDETAWENANVGRITQENVGKYLQSVADSAGKSMVMEAEMNLSALRITRELGDGAFANVYLVQRRRDRRSMLFGLTSKLAASPDLVPLEFALKRMSKGHLEEQFFSRSTMDAKTVKAQLCNERDLMHCIDSPFVIKLYKSWQDSQFLYLLEELAPFDLGHLYQKTLEYSPDLSKSRKYGDLDQDMFRCDSPRGSTIQFYMSCVMMALEHIHERRIVHRDLKLNNILIGRDGYAKLCDFGMAKFLLGKTYTLCGTPQYMAPEIMDHVGYGLGVDWWALGVITFELFTAQLPWPPECECGDDFVQMQRIRANHESPDLELLKSTNTPTLAQDFIRRLICAEVDKRLGKSGAVEVRSHAWFKMAFVDFAKLERQELKAPYTPSKGRKDDWSSGESVDHVFEGDDKFVEVDKDDTWDTWAEIEHIENARYRDMDFLSRRTTSKTM